MPRSTKPRKKYRGGIAMLRPITMGLTKNVKDGFDLRELAALDRLFAHDPTDAPADLDMFQTTAETSIRMVDHAIQNPREHDVPVEQLQVMRPHIINGARAVLLVAERWTSRKAYGCTAVEREDIATLVNCARALRDGMPRRLHLIGHELCLTATDGIRLPRERIPT